MQMLLALLALLLALAGCEMDRDHAARHRRHRPPADDDGLGAEIDQAAAQEYRKVITAARQKGTLDRNARRRPARAFARS